MRINLKGTVEERGINYLRDGICSNKETTEGPDENSECREKIVVQRKQLLQTCYDLPFGNDWLRNARLIRYTRNIPFLPTFGNSSA